MNRAFTCFETAGGDCADSCQRCCSNCLLLVGQHKPPGSTSQPAALSRAAAAAPAKKRRQKQQQQQTTPRQQQSSSGSRPHHQNKHGCGCLFVSVTQGNTRAWTGQARACPDVSTCWKCVCGSLRMRGTVVSCIRLAGPAVVLGPLVLPHMPRALLPLLHPQP